MNAAVAAVAAAALLVAAANAQGAGPFFGNERVLLVANAASPFSLAIANRWATLRHVPREHVLVLDGVPGEIAGATPISLADCTARLLQPVAAFLRERALADEIDCIVWSSGFPHAVDLGNLPVTKQQYVGTVASLTGLTAALREVVAGDTSCIALDWNGFAARGPGPVHGRGFGDHPRGRGHGYESVMLTWLGPFGLSFAEAMQQLERSAAADASAPTGTFYLLKNADVRATTREPLFAPTIDALRARGRPAALLAAGVDGQDGVLPRDKHDVLGAVVGISDFDWSKCGSTILPGAIVEHLTSFGATFQAAGQTKLTAFLRAGAAGASGTVTEPYALQAKFPTPFVHVYYADGCSLAEAFHQSVTGPYQLLIVGDACCRPFATFAPWTPPELPATWSGVVALQPTAEGATAFEAWLDGALVARAKSGEGLSVPTTALPDGPHELHLVAIGPAPVLVPTAFGRQILVQNHGLAASLQGPAAAVELGQRITVTGKVPNGATWELRCGPRVLARGTAANGSVRTELPSATLGLGAASLQLAAQTPAGAVVAAPLAVTTTPAKAAGAGPAPGAPLPGLAVDVLPKGAPANKAERRGTLAFGDPLDVPADGRATVRGVFQLATAGLHEWTLGNAELHSLQLDGKPVVPAARAAGDEGAGRGLVIDLAAGWHRFELELTPREGPPPRLSLTGPAGAVAFADAACGQAPFGLEPAPKEKLQPKNAAWLDGDRTKPAPPGGDAAEFACQGALKIGAIAAYFPGLGDAARDLADQVIVETRESGAWSPIRAADLRVLRGRPGGADVACLLAVAGGRKVQQFRLRAAAKSTALQNLAEVEVRLGAPK